MERSSILRPFGHIRETCKKIHGLILKYFFTFSTRLTLVVRLASFLRNKPQPNLDLESDP
jgi:hypothetical protein